MQLTREGRVWVFGDNINTDLIFPNRAFRLPEQEQHTLAFSANRPGWVEQVRTGDLIVGGVNFGMGSGRPVGSVLAACGLRGLVAESINGLCLRNCIAYGFSAMECPGVTTLFHEGEMARVDFVSGRVTNLTTDASVQGKGLPSLFLETILSGGVIEMLVREGYVEGAPSRVRSRVVEA